MRVSFFTFAGGRKPHPLIALEDIGWFARYLFANRRICGGRTLRDVGDQPTLDEVATTFERVTGIPTEWRDLPLTEVAAFPRIGHDLANMYKLFQMFGVQRDLVYLRSLHPRLMRFEDWLRKTGWRGNDARSKQESGTEWLLDPAVRYVAV